MATGEASGAFITASGPTNGAVVDLWLASRFGGQPAYGAAPPGGSPDAGPVTTSTTFGAPGAWSITGVAEGQFYARAVFSGNSYWAGPFEVIENSDVAHLSGVEIFTGNKEFDGTVKLGKGTAVTTLTGAGALQSTVDDGSGNMIVKGTLKSLSASTTIPNIWFSTVASGAVSFGTNYGLDLDANSAIAINAKSGANGGVYTMLGGTKSNILDDGSGNASIAAGLTVGTGFTLTSGTMTLPNASIPAAAVAGLGAGFSGMDLSTSQNVTGQKTFFNDLPVTGGKALLTMLPSPAAPVITQHGSAGSTVALYAVVGTTYDGRDTIPSSIGATTAGNATLTGANYNIITGAAITGSSTYKILKWSGTQWQTIATGLSTPVFNDTGGAAVNYTPIVVNPGGEITATSLTLSSDISNAGGQYIGTALGSVATPTVTPTGGSAGVSYTYAVVPVTADGRDGLETTGSTSTGVAFGSLTQAVYNNITWVDIANAAGYRVIRTAGGTSQGQITSTVLPPNVTSFKDTGITAAAYVAATGPVGGEISGATVAANANTASVVSARMVGLVPAGGPASGTWKTGDYGFDSNGHTWFCTAGGAPGTWAGTGVQAAYTAGAGTTTSSSYGDLTGTTVGPAVTLNTLTSVLVDLSAQMSHTTKDNICYMSFAVSGASTIVANSTGHSIQYQVEANTATAVMGGRLLCTGLTPGVNIFTCKYAASAATGTVTYRTIAVTPLDT